MKRSAPKKQKRNWRLLGFLAAVLAVKLIVVWQLKDHVLLRTDATIDTQTYATLAEAATISPLMKQSEIMQIMILYQDVWFALPAFLLMGVGFISNK